MKRVLVMALGGALCTTAAYAQSTEPQDPAAGAAAAQDAAPAGEAPAAPATEVSDADVESFAKATVKLQEIDADTTLEGEQKQAAMAAAVQEVGLDPAKYNQIAQAVGTDTALRDKVVAAMGRVQGAPAAGPTG